MKQFVHVTANLFQQLNMTNGKWDATAEVVLVVAEAKYSWDKEKKLVKSHPLETLRFFISQDDLHELGSGMIELAKLMKEGKGGVVPDKTPSVTKEEAEPSLL